MASSARALHLDASANPGETAGRAPGGRSADLIVTIGGVPTGSNLNFVNDCLKRIFVGIGIAAANLIAAGRIYLDRDCFFAGTYGRIDQSKAAAAKEQI